MADRKISDLTALTTPATGDLLPIVDVSEAAAADKNKSITVGELLRGAPDGTAAAPGIAFESDGGNGFYLAGTDTVGISTNGTGRLFVGSAGTVNVKTTGGSDLFFVDDNTSKFYFSPNGSGEGIIKLDTANAIRFLNAGGERLRITSDGKLGLGTSSPGTFNSFANDLVIGNGSGTHGLTIYSGSTGNANLNFADGTTGTDLYQAYINYNHSTDKLQFFVNYAGSSDPRLVIDSSGRVGVGTTSPTGTLHLSSSDNANTFIASGTNGRLRVFGHSTSFGGPWVSATNVAESSYLPLTLTGSDIVFANGGSERARIDSSGRVGIGTSTPNELLEVSGTENQGIRLTSTAGSGEGANLQWYSMQTGDNKITAEIESDGSGTGGNLFFKTRSTAGVLTDRMLIDNAGRVGIGTTTPGTPLNVQGLIRAQRSDVSLGTGIRATQIGCESGVGSLDTVSNDGQFLNLAFRQSSDGSTYTERARIDTSGRLLVGTSSSTTTFVGSAQVELKGISAAAATSAIVCDTASDSSFGLLLNKTGTPGNNYQLGRISFGSGNERGAEIRCEADGAHAAGDRPGRLVFSTTADGASSPTERVRITNDGYVAVGTQSSTFGGNTGAIIGPVESAWTVSVAGQVPIRIYNKDTTGTRYCMEFRNASAVVGSITHNGTNAAFNTTSDYRLKEHIAPVADGIARLQQLKPSRFNFITAPDHTVDGFIAHEVQAVVPEAVTGTKDDEDEDGNPVYQGIDQSKLVPLLTAALQEAVAKIESLEARLTAAGI